MRGLHERLFYRPLLEAFSGPALPAHDRPATEELLAGLGFAAPARSYDVLARVVDPSTRIGKVVANAFPLMAPALALAADPDAALVRLERVAEAVGERRGPADALASDPGAARRLAHAVAASSFATDLIVADPERLRALADGVVHASDAAADLVRAIARFAARELAPRETGDAIASVADRVLHEAVDAAAPDLPFAVIGMGKLGASELNFASDLDVLFVYEGEGPDDLHRAGAAAERVLQHVREAGWEPDADLRPEGRNGPLARSIAGYLEYWSRYAETWEFQSLLRARAVAGDAALGRRFELNAADFAYPPEGLTVDRVGEIRHMRDRIERERVRPPEAARFHFKLGVGSLADVQFAVELSLMRHGGEHPEVRSRQTLDAIERLAAARLLPDAAAHALGEAFVFLSDVKNALEVDRRLHAEALPASPGGSDLPRPPARLRGVPAAEPARRLPAHHPSQPAGDGAPLPRGPGVGVWTGGLGETMDPDRESEGGRSMLKEFREFISKGNLVTIAVAFIIGVAFAAVVTAFTDVVLGVVSYVFGGDVSFDGLGVHRNGSIVIPYGRFLTALVNFLIVAFILFLVVKAYNRFQREEEAAPAEPSDEVKLLTQIRDELAKRP